MKIQVRVGVFETNSSSLHSLILCTKEQWDKFLSGELIAYFYKEKLLSKNDPEVLKYNDGMTYEEYEKVDYSTFFKTLTLPNGDEVIAFGYYGYDS